MVRVINIDTKTRTIRVSNGKDDLEWFTTDTGSHVPLKKGQSKAEAIKEHFGDKKQNPQLERLEKMGKAWGKDQMSVLRELGKTNPQGLKDELDRIEAERERTTKAHKEWLKEKADKQQPAKKSAAQIFKDAGDDTGWKSIKSGSHHQFFDENNWAQREHEYVYLPDGDDSFDNYARIEKDTDGDPRVVVTLVKDGERVYKDPFDGYDDQAGNMQAAIEAVARAFGK